MDSGDVYALTALNGKLIAGETFATARGVQNAVDRKAPVHSFPCLQAPC